MAHVRMVSVFLDTNILIYAAQGKDVKNRHEISQGLLTSEFGISAQVLAEFYHNVTRKGDAPLSPEVATEWVDALSRKPCAVVDAELIMGGIDVSRRFQTSYWDGAIVAAAERLGADILYTEDLNHGQFYGSVRVLNPFKSHPDFS